MELDWIPRWWGVITTVVAVLATIAMLWLSKTFARREDIKQVEITMADHGTRILNVEEKLATLPTQEEMAALRLEMSDMRGDIRALREALKPVNHVAQLLLEQRLNER